MEVRHIIPLGDIQPHQESLECPCNPILYEGDRWDECLHQSFDNRELIIGIEVMLGIRCGGCGSYKDAKGEHTDQPPPPFYEYDHK